MATQTQRASFFTTPAEMKAIAQVAPEELITGLVPSGGVMVLAGAPGLGKSFIALSWAAAVAEGSSWFGKAVRQAPVVYVLGEGWGGFGRRITAWEQANQHVISEQLHFVNGVRLGIDFSDGESVDQLIERVEAVEPGLIVVDTFSMLARVSNENDNAEVAAVMANISKVVSETGATVMLVHHVTKTTGSVRGASAFVGNADTVVMVKEEGTTAAEKKGFFITTDRAYDGKQRDGMAETLRGFSVASPGVLERDGAVAEQRQQMDAAKAAAFAAMAAKQDEQNNDSKEQ